MIDEQYVFCSRLRPDEHGAVERLRELHSPRDIRTPSVTSVVKAHMQSRGDDHIANVFGDTISHILDGQAPRDAIEALADMVSQYDTDDDDDDDDDALRYLESVTSIPAEPQKKATTTALTPLHRRLFDAMNRHEKRAAFSELREAWASDVQEETIIRTLKRLRKKLPRSQWDFEISEANWEIVWHKKGQAVP